ncbi:hypothetical protein BaRGS_00012290 [Batillaria attramentaria]|uniref:Uncharacterized protein n=1 Tax=Batillaria attramentaria TaxID=370345 RepID=A0ABD0LAZ1_9CAEN
MRRLRGPGDDVGRWRRRRGHLLLEGDNRHEAHLSSAASPCPVTLEIGHSTRRHYRFTWTSGLGPKQDIRMLPLTVE